MSANGNMDGRPLLNNKQDRNDAPSSGPIISSTGNNMATALGIIRSIAGGAAMIAPTFVGKLFYVPITHPQAMFIMRLWGGREVAVGDLTYFTRPKADGNRTVAQATVERKNLRNVLLANLAIDSLDIVWAGVALYQGHLGRAGFLGVSGGATVFVLMALTALKGLQ